MRRVMLTLLAVALLVGACGNEGADDGLRASIEIDGSSTVFPISQAVAEEFTLEHRGVKIAIGLSGTGGGFEKFCRGEIEISNASRPIKQAEADVCAAEGIAFTELKVAIDGLSIVVHPKNDWVDC